jgi:hypothetical protein
MTYPTDQIKSEAEREEQLKNFAKSLGWRVLAVGADRIVVDKDCFDEKIRRFKKEFPDVMIILG